MSLLKCEKCGKEEEQPEGVVAFEHTDCAAAARLELLYQIWDLRNFLAGITLISDAALAARLAGIALERNAEPGIRRPDHKRGL